MMEHRPPPPAAPDPSTNPHVTVDPDWFWTAILTGLGGIVLGCAVVWVIVVLLDSLL